MNKPLLAATRPLIILFVILTAICVVSKSFLTRNGISQEVVLAGNLLLFLVSLSAFFLTHRSLSSSNPNAFVRAIYGSFFIKFFVLAIAAFIYIMIAKKGVNKPGLMICAALYIVYTAMETRTLVKQLKNRKNA